MASLLLALHPAAFFTPGGRLSAAARVSAPTMVDADVQTQIEQLQAKLELMRLKAQLEELQRQAAAPSAPVVPEMVASAPPTLAQAEPIASAAAAVAATAAATSLTLTGQAAVRVVSACRRRKIGHNCRIIRHNAGHAKSAPCLLGTNPLQHVVTQMLR